MTQTQTKHSQVNKVDGSIGYIPTEGSGRPTSYTDTIAEEILYRLQCGESLRAICRLDHMPSRPTVYTWLRERPSFLDHYERARQSQADSLFDDVIDISDTEDDPRRAKVRIDARIWAAGKLKPKKYGDTKHIQVDQTITLTDDQLDQKIAQLARQTGVTIEAEYTDVTDQNALCDHNSGASDGQGDT